MIRPVTYLGESTEIDNKGDAFYVHWVTDGRGDYSVVLQRRTKKLVCVFENTDNCVHVQTVARAIRKMKPSKAEEE